MRTSRLSRRLESIIKFIVQIFPFIILLFVFVSCINSFNFSLTINDDFPSALSSYVESSFLSFSGICNSFLWLDVFNFSDLVPQLISILGIDVNDVTSVLIFSLYYIIWLIYVEFLWLIKDVLLACPRIVSKFINKLTGGDLD